MVRGAALDALAVLLPVDCAGCGARDRALCDACRARLLPRCARRVLGDGTIVFTALRYDGVVRSTILALKEQGRTDVARALAGSLTAAVAAALGATTAGTTATAITVAGAGAAGAAGTGGVVGVELVTIPPSRAAFRRRGYDPVALVLAKAGLPLAQGVLVSVRRHTQQKELGREERQRNLVGSLQAGHPLAGRRFILVDDVVTTGSTMIEAVRAVREGGGEVLRAVALANTARLFDDFHRSPSKLVTSPDDGATVSGRGAGFTTWFRRG
jgi:predicted amidophosphoribosyltransferase